MIRKLTALSLASVLACSMLAHPAQAAAPAFSDVPTSAPYYQQVLYCRELGITYGVGDNLFNPDAEITSTQVFTMLLRAYYPDETFEDPILGAVEKNLTDGSSLKEPNMHFLLRNLVKLVFYMADIPVYYENPMDTAIELGLYPETETGDRMATRADCAYLIANVLQNTYQAGLPKSYEYLNVVVEPGYDSVTGKTMKEIQALPDAILDAWHNSGKQLIFGNNRIAQFIEEENYTSGVTGLYHSDGITLNSAQSAIHEFGHFVYYESNYPGLILRVNQLYNQYKDITQEYLSEYSAKNEQEFFAECFETYFGAGDTGMRISLMQEKMPDAYQLLTDLAAKDWGFSA